MFFSFFNSFLSFINNKFNSWLIDNINSIFLENFVVFVKEDVFYFSDEKSRFFWVWLYPAWQESQEGFCTDAIFKKPRFTKLRRRIKLLVLCRSLWKPFSKFFWKWKQIACNSQDQMKNKCGDRNLCLKSQFFSRKSWNSFGLNYSCFQFYHILDLFPNSIFWNHV